MSIDSARVRLTALGPSQTKAYDVPCWSLKGLQCAQDKPSQKMLVNALYTELNMQEIRTAYAPHVAPQSGVVVGVEAIRKNHIRLGNNTELFRNKDVPADGTFLKPESAFVMSAAGCPVIIAVAGEHMIVAHAGRDSLIDRFVVAGRDASRTDFSVVHAIVRTFVETKCVEKAEEIAMCMAFAIPPMVFCHPFADTVFGEYNRKLASFASSRWEGGAIITKNGVHLDLQAIFHAQAREVGVERTWVTHSLAEHTDLAHTRDGVNRDRRNLIIVGRMT
ncbi:MAG TPA: hypothetical protein VM103_02550 [Candidatus Paceibacterota bacterium]|nr:hypothetical protein [Candidatus Paceibacterota bacterium]